MSLNEIYSALLSLYSNLENFILLSLDAEYIVQGIYDLVGIRRGYLGLERGCICVFNEEIYSLRL